MSRRSPAHLYLASWGSILLNTPLTINAAAAASTTRFSIPDLVKRKNRLLSEYSRYLQLGGWDGTGEFSISSIPPPTGLTEEQFDGCILDQVLADTNMDFELDKDEYLTFLYINSARNGYIFYSSDQDTFAELPLEFPMLFHSTACLCAYEEVGTQPPLDVDFGCCEGDNEHILVYDTAGLFGELSDEEYAYSSLFCAEAINLYPEFLVTAATITTAPTIAPSTGFPTTFEPSIAITDVPTTIFPTTIAPTTDPPSTVIPTASPSVKVTTLSPTEFVETDSPTAEVTTLSPTEFVETDSPTAAVTSPSPTEVVETDSPTAAVTTLSPTDVVETDSPTAVEAFPTISPVLETSSPTNTILFPTISPSVGTAPPVASVVETSSPTTTIVFPTVSPTVGTATVSPTSSPVIAVLTSSPTIASTSTDLAIEIQYDYNSDCGVTAEDVMSGNDGITLMEGFVTATEAIVVDILNSTYPRDENSSPTPSPVTTSVSGESLAPTTQSFNESEGTTLPTPSASSEESGGTSAPSSLGTATTSTIPTAASSGGASEGGSGATLVPTVGTFGGASEGGSGGTYAPTGLGTATTSTTPTAAGSGGASEGGSDATMSPTITGTSGTDATFLPAVLRSGSNSSKESFLRGATFHDKAAAEDPSAKTSENFPYSFIGMRTRVDEWPNPTDSDGRRRGSVVLQSGLRRRRHQSYDLAQQFQRRSRLLVYYTQMNPIVISDVEDVLDSCPSGSTCMKVTSTVTVTLEAGDDPDEVEEAIRSGFEQSIQDASFAQALPADTVSCPAGGDSSPAPSPVTTGVSGESLVPTTQSFNESEGTTLPTPSASSEESGGTSAPSSLGTATTSTIPTAASSGGASEGGSGATLVPTVGTFGEASEGGSGGTYAPTGLGTATTSTTPTAAGSGGASEGGSSGTLSPTLEGGSDATLAPTGLGTTASSSTSTIAASNETSDEGTPPLPSLALRNTGAGEGGEIPTYPTMMDMGSIHSKKSSLDSHPT
ncbi:hypothetical protein ACHAXA_002674 [Cyclostephanos tholiformis]|uniref:Uncharacterized protein n=1 Tax=Cyclostephanos tholiformis TaxID=382380 RepID=A0ABD3S027_9STRA